MRSGLSFRNGEIGIGLAASLAAAVLLVGCTPHAREATTAAKTAESSADWLATAQRSIAEREYHASASEGGLQAPNRAQNLRTWFEPSGIRVHDRTAGGSPALVELRLAAFGRAGQLEASAPGEVTSDAGRVEIRRGDLVEWFENTPKGLEQGFTLAERPTGTGGLVVELAVEQAKASLRGEEIALTTQAGRKLGYGELVAVDADGRTLGARFEVPAPDRIRLVVDDAGARYPLTIDPLLVASADARLESDQVNASLGYSVAGAGDVNGDGFADAIVGAPSYDNGQTDEGAAFVFLGSAAGIVDAGAASAQAQLESNQLGAAMAWSVAGAGDVNGDGYADVIVGARAFDNGEANEGAAFVFLGSASGIADGNPATAHAQLEANQLGAEMGWSVAGAGDVNGDGFADVLVGVHLYDAGQADEGAAFVFLGSASGIADGNPATAHAQLESDQASAAVGFSVAGAGDVNGDGFADVLVGAQTYDNGEAQEGAAFVFLGSPSGIADGNPVTAHAQLESNQPGAFLGATVAGAGDVNGDGFSDVIVGAGLYDAGQADEGAAFVFLGSPSGIADGNPVTAHAQLESNQTTAQMGFSVAGAGDVNGDGFADVIVGANLYDFLQSDEGAAFVFLGSANGIADGNPLIAHARLYSHQANARGGTGVAGAGDVNGDGFADVIVGANGYSGGQANEGVAFVYVGGAIGIRFGNPTTAQARLESNQTGALMGRSVAGAGDVNGDGFADVIVGAYLYDAGQVDEGAAFVFLGSATGIPDAVPASAHARLESNQAGAAMGYSVAGAGDVNGDGFSDVLVGAVGYDGGETNEGATFVFLGSASGISDGNPATAHAQLESNQADASLGRSLASAGDVNGDGYSDVIVGAHLFDAGQADEGAAFVFLGSASGIADGNPATAHAQLEANQATALLGQSVAGAGDVNGDGFADVIVGANAYDSGQPEEGAAFVFLGGPSGIADGNPATAHAQLESNQGSANLGTGVAGAGDVNGDGYADVIVGAYFYDSGQLDEGAAFVFLGGPSGIVNRNPATAHAQLESDQASAFLGYSVAGAGDVNGDGYADVIVGAYFYENFPSNEGAAFIFLGSPSGIADATLFAATRIESDQNGAALGETVAGAGDVNGDGLADVIVSAHLYDSGQADEGTAFVFESGEVDGRPVFARQAQPGGSPVVQAWGSVPNAFQISLQASHPEGRGLVKLESEWCRTGLPFGDPGCGRQIAPAWTAVSTSPVSLVQNVAGLSPDTLYRWRARVLYAPTSITQPGVVAPTHPAHGPWRRHQAQAFEADVRTVPEPGIGIALASGIVWLAGRARRRG